MEFETLSHIHLISPVDPGIPKELPNSAFHSFIFDIENEKELLRAFEFIFSTENKTSFSVTLSSTSDKWSNYRWMDKLILILSNPFYLKYHEKLILPVHAGTGLPVKREFLNFLSDKLKAQGLDDVIIFDLNEANLQKKGPFRVYDSLSSGKFYDHYLDDLIDSGSLLNIFVDSGNTRFYEELLELKNEAENRLQKDQPLMYRLIKNLQLRSSEVDEHRAIINLLGEDLASKKTYLDFVLGKFKEEQGSQDQPPLNVDVNAIMKMKKFYHHEYEILPLWYKRFGHIIKVIMGKRTFRSLFDDNVEKYKN